MGGTPGLDGGQYPRSVWWGRGLPQVWMVGGYPWVWMVGGYLRSGSGVPQSWMEGVPIRHNSIVSTCYPAGDMPIAFTQEDFLFSFAKFGIASEKSCGICS